ncbi:MAG: hypothetical protein ACYTFV_18400 [Planctomycetota bacterium]|jgi:hypothetical protein
MPRSRAELEEAMQAEGRRAFGGFVGPATLAAQVEVGAPYLFDSACPRFDELGAATDGARLFELAAAPLGWWRCVLESERLKARPSPSPQEVTDYFALCLAAHWASAPSYVPTDVDAKIRRALWRDQSDEAERERMRSLALGTGDWDVRGFSARTVEVDGEQTLGGHDGERLSVWCGALVDAWRGAKRGDGVAEGWRDRLTAAVDTELAREARAIELLAAEPGRELELLEAAAIATHNVGDVNQGLGVGSKPRPPADLVERFGDVAARLYRELLASEGHRHYPLRAARVLRVDPVLQLPVPPMLDGWGGRVATYDGRLGSFGAAQRAEVVAALVEGVRRIPGQRGYQRALAGFEQAHPGGFAESEFAERLPAATRKALAKGPLRKELDTGRRAFESALAKATRKLLRAVPRAGRRASIG